MEATTSSWIFLRSRRWTRSVRHLCQTFLTHRSPGSIYHATHERTLFKPCLPSACVLLDCLSLVSHRIAPASVSEQQLRDIGLGYRAKFVVGTLEKLRENGGETWLEKFRDFEDRTVGTLRPWLAGTTTTFARSLSTLPFHHSRVQLITAVYGPDGARGVDRTPRSW